MPMPATPKKSPMKAFVTLTPRKPMSANERVVRVVAKAPMARAVYGNSQYPNLLQEKLFLLFIKYSYRASKLGFDGNWHWNVIRLSRQRPILERGSSRWTCCDLACCQSLVEVSIRLDIVQPFKLLDSIFVTHFVFQSKR